MRVVWAGPASAIDLVRGWLVDAHNCRQQQIPPTKLKSRWEVNDSNTHCENVAVAQEVARRLDAGLDIPAHVVP